MKRRIPVPSHGRRDQLRSASELLSVASYISASLILTEPSVANEIDQHFRNDEAEAHRQYDHQGNHAV